MTGIKENLALIKQQIKEACEKVAGNPDQVTLVAVTKTLPVTIIEEACQYGVKNIGENKVQEFIDKYEQLQHLPLSWHFIGHLQTNKVKYIIDKVALIHSVDRLKLAEEINRECTKKNLTANILIQVNVSGEVSKFGVVPEEAPGLIRQIASLERIKIKGLMTMAPYTETPEEVRTVFAKLKELAGQIRQQNIPRVNMEELSMGMTNDFQIAIEEGASLVRVGSGIFGTREYK